MGGVHGLAPGCERSHAAGMGRHLEQATGQGFERFAGAEAGVAIAAEGLCDLAPVFGGQEAAGRRQHQLFFGAHVVPLLLCERAHLLRERRHVARLQRCAHGLELLRASHVLLLELVEQGIAFVGPRTQPRNRWASSLGWCKPFGKLLDVEHHRAQQASDRVAPEGSVDQRHAGHAAPPPASGVRRAGCPAPSARRSAGADCSRQRPPAPASAIPPSPCGSPTPAARL